MKDRNRLRYHIRAAREWLGQADTSLEMEKDVQGDLKLMLARAELQRAAETSEHPRGRFLKLVPLAVAAVFAATWIGWNHHEDAPAGSGTQESAIVETKPGAGAHAEDFPASALGAGRTEESILSQESRVTEDADLRTAPEALADDIPGKWEEPPPRAREEVQEPERQEKAEPFSGSAPAIPSADMQKLMQSAGKVLRAE